MSPRGRHPHNRLTDRMVRQAGPGKYCDGGCLYLVVEPSGSRHWVFNGMVRGRRRELGLGGYPTVSLAAAREKALKYRRIAREGGDPSAGTAKKACPTVREVFELVTENRRTAWKTPTTEAGWRRDFEKYVAPVIGDMPIAAVSLDHLRSIVVPHWGGRNSKGYVLRQNLEAIFAWAVAQQHRPDNPAANLRDLLPKVKAPVRHRPSLPYAEAPAALADLQKLDVREPVKLVVLFIVLTAARLGEATGATWREIDLANGVWQVPPERMKSRDAHSVPLSAQAVEILGRAKRLPGDGSLVFPVLGRNGRTRAVTQDMVSAALRKLGRSDPDGRPIVAHGFRSTFRRWSIEVFRVTREVGEAALAHGESDRTVAAYTRGADPFDDRTELMRRWADYVLPVVKCLGNA